MDIKHKAAQALEIFLQCQEDSHEHEGHAWVSHLEQFGQECYAAGRKSACKNENCDCLCHGCGCIKPFNYSSKTQETEAKEKTP